MTPRKTYKRKIREENTYLVWQALHNANQWREHLLPVAQLSEGSLQLAEVATPPRVIKVAEIGVQRILGDDIHGESVKGALHWDYLISAFALFKFGAKFIGQALYYGLQCCHFLLGKKWIDGCSPYTVKIVIDGPKSRTGVPK